MNQMSLGQEQVFDTSAELPQKQRILNTLKNANTWVCGTTFQRMFIPTYSQRINIDLKKDGHKIFSKNPSNVLFYVKNLIFKNDKTPKEIRLFQCFMCSENFVFPLTSKDYTACNECWKDL